MKRNAWLVAYAVGATIVLLLALTRQPWPRAIEPVLWFSVGFGLMAAVQRFRRA